MTNKLKFIIILLLSFCVFTACEHFEKRRQQETGENSQGKIPRESFNKSKIRDLEKRLTTKQEKQMYSKLLPWFLDDEERIAFLSQSNFENRQEWIQNSGILSRQNQLGQKYKRVIDNQDIAIGMPNDLVKKSWGDPVQVETSGNPLYKNEKWKYIRNVSSSEGFKQERRVVYFENGKVVGWETE